MLRKPHIVLAREHSLTKHGYHVAASSKKRRLALMAAIAEQSGKKGGFRQACNYVVRKLNALYVFNKNRHPDLAASFRRDMEWVQRFREYSNASKRFESTTSST